jgi:hypothetical protein
MAKENVFALLVCVEKYESPKFNDYPGLFGQSWKLRDLLIKNDVPESHIAICLTREQTDGVSNTPANVTCFKSATRDGFDKALEYIKQKVSDYDVSGGEIGNSVLFIHWIGHGVVTQNESRNLNRKLIYSNYSSLTERASNLDFDSLSEFLRFADTGFPQNQVFWIDSCGTYLDAEKKQWIETHSHEYPERDLKSNRRNQHIFFASSIFQAAKVDQQKNGNYLAKFSSVILEKLSEEGFLSTLFNDGDGKRNSSAFNQWIETLKEYFKKSQEKLGKAVCEYKVGVSEWEVLVASHQPQQLPNVPLPDCFLEINDTFLRGFHNPPITFEDIATDNFFTFVQESPLYVERAEQEKLLEDVLKLGEREGVSIFLLTGRSGVGKTTLAYWLAYQLYQKHRVLYLDKNKKPDEKPWFDQLRDYCDGRECKNEIIYCLVDEFYPGALNCLKLSLKHEGFSCRLVFIATAEKSMTRNQYGKSYYKEYPIYGFTNDEVMQLSQKVVDHFGTSFPKPLKDAQRKTKVKKLRNYLKRSGKEGVNLEPKIQTFYPLFLRLQILWFMKSSNAEDFNAEDFLTNTEDYLTSRVRILAKKQTEKDASEPPAYDVVILLCHFFQHRISIPQQILSLCFPKEQDGSYENAAWTPMLNNHRFLIHSDNSLYYTTFHPYIAKFVLELWKSKDFIPETKVRPPSYSHEDLEPIDRYLNQIIIPKLDIENEIQLSWLIHALGLLTFVGEKELVSRALQQLLEDNKLETIWEKLSISQKISWIRMYEQLGNHKERKLRAGLLISTIPQNGFQWFIWLKFFSSECQKQYKISGLKPENKAKTVRQVLVHLNEWLMDNFQDQYIHTIFHDYLGLLTTQRIDQHDLDDKQYIDIVIDLIEKWITLNSTNSSSDGIPNHYLNTYVRYLKFIQYRGSKYQQQKALKFAREWLGFTKSNEETYHLWTQILRIFEKRGTLDDKNNALDKIGEVLKVDRERFSLRDRYLLLARHLFLESRSDLHNKIEDILDQQWLWIGTRYNSDNSFDQYVDKNVWYSFLNLLAEYTIFSIEKSSSQSDSENAIKTVFHQVGEKLKGIKEIMDKLKKNKYGKDLYRQMEVTLSLRLKLKIVNKISDLLKSQDMLFSKNREFLVGKHNEYYSDISKLIQRWSKTQLKSIVIDFPAREYPNHTHHFLKLVNYSLSNTILLDIVELNAFQSDDQRQQPDYQAAIKQQPSAHQAKIKEYVPGVINAAFDAAGNIEKFSALKPLMLNIHPLMRYVLNQEHSEFYEKYCHLHLKLFLLRKQAYDHQDIEQRIDFATRQDPANSPREELVHSQAATESSEWLNKLDKPLFDLLVDDEKRFFAEEWKSLSNALSFLYPLNLPTYNSLVETVCTELHKEVCLAKENDYDWYNKYKQDGEAVMKMYQIIFGPYQGESTDYTNDDLKQDDLDQENDPIFNSESNPESE